MIVENAGREKETKTETVYFPAIDSLRAIAVLFVLIHHYIERFSDIWTLGNTGVDIFFVISGFLITSIILTYKDKHRIAHSLKIFYVRRTLRIFPLYYMYLIIVSILYWDNIKNVIPFTATYCQNFYEIIYVRIPPLSIAHFWSLSVEEQFYLVWPFLILIIPKRYLRPFILSAIGFSILFSLTNTFVFHVKYVEYMHLISCMQSLALGGLLALLYKMKSSILLTVRKYTTVLLILCVGGWAFCVSQYANTLWLFTFLRTFNGLIAFIILTKLIMPQSRLNGYNRIFYVIMNSAVLQFIGRISYGIYVYHLLVRLLLEPYVKEVISANDWLYWHSYIVSFPLYSAVTIALAYISFRFIESPINSLKNRFTIRKVH